MSNKKTIIEAHLLVCFNLDMKKVNAILVFLISSLTITGISFVDGKIWDIIFIIVGMIAYAIVGFFFSIGLLSTKKDGQGAFAFVFFLLILGGYGVYKGLEALRKWILSWPLAAKIIVPSVIGTIIIIGIFLTTRYALKNKNKLKKDFDNEEE